MSLLALTLGVALASPPPSPSAPPPAFVHGRRLGVAGLVLGWAGPGLAVGGGMVVLTGASTAPLEARPFLRATALTGVGLGAVGLTLQVTGSRMQGRALLGLERPRQPRGRVAGFVLASGAAVAGGAFAWTIAREEGAWTLPTGALAGLLTLGATGVHTAVLLDADAEVGLVVAPRQDGWTVGVAGRF